MLAGRYPGGELPDSVTAAIDSLPALRSLHVAGTFRAHLTEVPSLDCLSRLTSFGVGGKFPEVPLQLAQLARCRNIDLSLARFKSHHNLEAVLGGMLAEAAAPAAGGGAIERTVWVDGHTLEERCSTFGRGVVCSTGRRQPRPHEIMTNDDFRDQSGSGGDAIF